MAMLQAYLQFHATKFSREDRERGTWLLLFVWAWHGGRPGDPVPGSAPSLPGTSNDQPEKTR
jgi:hypothetical protein